MDSVILKEIGNRISSKRRQLDMTQEFLADKMGVSVQMISNLERGNKAIRIDNLINLCELLEVSTDYILKGIPTENDNNEMSKKIAELSESDRKMIEFLISYCLNK